MENLEERMEHMSMVLKSSINVMKLFAVSEVWGEGLTTQIHDLF